MTNTLVEKRQAVTEQEEHAAGMEARTKEARLQYQEAKKKRRTSNTSMTTQQKLEARRLSKDGKGPLKEMERRYEALDDEAEVSRYKCHECKRDLQEFMTQLHTDGIGRLCEAAAKLKEGHVDLTAVRLDKGAESKAFKTKLTEFAKQFGIPPHDAAIWVNESVTAFLEKPSEKAAAAEAGAATTESESPSLGSTRVVKNMEEERKKREEMERVLALAYHVLGMMIGQV